MTNPGLVEPARSPARKAPRRPPGDRIAEILAAARKVLAKNGYENFLPAEVAALCGVSEATIYRYFPTKRELLVKVAEQWFGEILAVEPEIARESDVFRQFRRVIRHSLTVIRQEPSLSRFVLTELRADPAYRSTHIYALNRRFTSAVVNLVKHAAEKGVFRRNVSPALVRDMIFGCIEHRTWAFLRGQGDFDVDEVAESIADILFHGLLRDAPIGADALERAVAGVQAGAANLDGRIRELKAALAPAPAPRRKRGRRVGSEPLDNR
ncbi:MAG: TetR/AcrR family transcriptional regulator [Roseiarcus sp.]|jgi:AcrR family transcriptional regulator